MKLVKGLVTGTVLAILLIATTAHGIEMTGGVIEAKKYPLAGKHEFVLQMPIQLGSNFADSTLVGLQYMYHVWEYFGFGIDGAYAFSADESFTMRQIRTEANGSISVLRQFPIDLDRRIVTYYGGIIAHWYPIYGRWSVAGSFDLSWDIITQVGGYMVGYKTFSAFHQADENAKIISNDGVDDITGVNPAANWGLGMRFYILKQLAFRFQYLGFAMFDKGVQYLPVAQRSSDYSAEQWASAYETAKSDSEANQSKINLLNYITIGFSGIF